MHRVSSLLGATALATALLLRHDAARADLVFSLGTVFNGSTPTSTPPWLTATFHTVATGDVTLTLAASLNVASEFIDDVAFNVDPTILPSSLTLTQSPLVDPKVTSFQNTTQNAQNLIGGGSAGSGFDVILGWATAAGVGRFDGTDSVTIDITGGSITENSFNFTNTGSANATVAAHVQGIPPIPPGSSGAVMVTNGTIPEPGGLALIAVAMAGLGLAWRRKPGRKD